MEETNKKQIRNFNLYSYTKRDSMIGTNDNAYNEGGYASFRQKSKALRDYTDEEIIRIINSGSIPEQQKLSRNYFYKDGYYKQIIIYYATLLQYAGLLIPNPINSKNLSNSNYSKKYYAAIDFIERMQLPTFCTNCAQKALVNGSYFGVIVDSTKTSFQVLDLPSGYCYSRFKDKSGNDIIEFDLSYFKTIIDETSRKAALAAYPDVISKAYKKYEKSGDPKQRWFMIPTDIGVCFPFFDGMPLLLNVIPASLAYDDAILREQEMEAEEIKKIIVQKVPHLTDGRLLFEPEEALDMHQGAVEMLKGNKKVNVLTTYSDVDAITSNTTNERTDDILNRAEQNIFAQAGVSGQIISSTSANSIEGGQQNDLALMMYFANKIGRFITNLVNSLYGNASLTFKYSFLPISYYNSDDYAKTSLQLANSGYSFIMPALAMGLTQKDLGNVKDLENNVLKLQKKLIPLSSSYTQAASADASETSETGRPELDDSDKSEKTLENEESL